MWIKLCGIVRPVDFELAVALEVDAVGVVSVKGTPRCISSDEARELGSLDRKKTKLVLVVQDPDKQELNEMILMLKPDLLQFHGQESAEFASQFSLPYIKATRSTSDSAIALLKSHRDAFAWIVDSRDDSDKRRLLFSHLIESHKDRRVILAGGLSPDNVRTRMMQVLPFGVDVSGGIEVRPREKDPDLMRRFVHAVRAAGA